MDREDDEHLILYEDGVPIGLLKYRPPVGGRCHLLYILVRTKGVRHGPRLLDEFLRRLSDVRPGWVVECEIESEEPERVRHLLVSRGFRQAGMQWERTV